MLATYVIHAHYTVPLAFYSVPTFTTAQVKLLSYIIQAPVSHLQDYLAIALMDPYTAPQLELL